MKSIKSKKKEILFLIIFLLMIIFTSKAFALEVRLDTTEEFENWKQLSEEEKEKTIMPQPYSIEIPEEILEEYEDRSTPNFIGSLLKSNETNFNTVSASSSDARFTLSNKLNIRVEHQGSTNECWAFSTIKSLETNIALKSGVTELKDFSERHMDYSSVRNFLDGTNPKGLNRKTGDGGLPIMGLAYLTNGQGAVLEKDMPFEDNSNEIYLRELDKKVDTIVTDYEILPTLNKSYTKDSQGNTISVTYKDDSGKVYTNEEVKAIRKTIKEHLINNGAIAAFTAGSKANYYNNPSSIFSSTNYNCNDENITRDHGITIVGWDDNYSRNNFREGKKPSSDGAYIVLNTYGENSFDNGYIYISYEDFFIESELYGVCSTSSVDYDNIYQYDDFGGILKLISDGGKTGYFANVFSRNNKETEIMNSVGVSLCEYANVEIYVNPNGSSLDSKNLTLVGKLNSTLNPGYHRIYITPTKLSSKEFAIVIKQTTLSGNTFAFQVEANVDGTIYDGITSNRQSYISVDGTEWSNLADITVDGVNMSDTDVCIKAFTIEQKENNNLTSSIYTINNQYIMNINYNTTKTQLLNNLNSNLVMKVYDENGNEISNENEVIKTGMIIKLSNNEEYVLIVRGDNNSDGKISILDVSRLKTYYIGANNTLDSYELKALDLNLDGKITITDVAQMMVLYNSI